MSVKNYEVTNNGSNTLHINIYNIYKDYEMRNGISGDYVYKLNSETKSINTGESLSNYKEINDTANVVKNLKEQKYKDIYDTYDTYSNKFFLLDAADNLQSKTPYTAKWAKNNAYDYYNIPMNIFIPITDGNVPQCNTNSALQDISTNIKLINNFYTQKFIPTNIKYTYSNKCSTLPSSNTEVLSTVIQLTEYSNNHNIYVPGPIKKIERDGYNINVWYYKVNNLYANSYANDIVTISKPANINLYQAQSDGSLTSKNVTLPYYLPIAAATPESSLPISNLPPSLLNENHFGLYSYADDNKLNLSCKEENDFLAGYSLKYQTNKYKITPYCIHFSNEPQPEPEPEQQPEEPKICRGEEYLNHRYEDTEAGKEFIINEGDPCEIRRLCNNGIWDEPISKCNCFIDNITLDEGMNYDLRDGTNATVYTCKRNGDYVELIKTSEKCVKDDKLYEEGEFTSSAMNDIVKYDKCVRENDKLTMKEINVCMKDGQEYNIGDSYSSSCDIGEGSIIHTCDNSGWKTDNKCTEKVEDDYSILIIIIAGIIILFIIIIFLTVRVVNSKKQSKSVRT